jgi:hypothetical protein
MSKFIFNCLYCGLDKLNTEISLEHAIPQFMGGDCAPEHFKLDSNVCKKCNNLLGLFVDASYAKSFFIANIFSEVARSLCTSITDPGLPLRYLGITKLDGLMVPAGHVAEYWIGPSGESVVWIREHDERMDSYAGGNPIDAKKKKSVAYFFPVSINPLTYEAGNLSFQRAFAKRRTRKIFCAEVKGSDGNSIDPLMFKDLNFPFDVPNSDDLHNREIISKAIASGNIPARILIDQKFDHRFICKMAMSVGYSLFGNDYLASESYIEARKGVWPPKEDSNSELRATSTSNFDDPQLAVIAGYPSAVVLTVMECGGRWTLILSIDQKIPFVVDLGTSSMRSSVMNVEEGYTLLLFPYLDKAIELTTATVLAHQLGNVNHHELAKIDDLRKRAASFSTQLVA